MRALVLVTLAAVVCVVFGSERSTSQVSDLHANVCMNKGQYARLVHDWIVSSFS